MAALALSGLMTSPAMWPRAGHFCLDVPAAPLNCQPLLSKKPHKENDPLTPQFLCDCWDPGAQRPSALSWSLGSNLKIQERFQGRTHAHSASTLFLPDSFSSLCADIICPLSPALYLLYFLVGQGQLLVAAFPWGACMAVFMCI